MANYTVEMLPVTSARTHTFTIAADEYEVKGDFVHFKVDRVVIFSARADQVRVIQREGFGGE